MKNDEIMMLALIRQRIYMLFHASQWQSSPENRPELEDLVCSNKSPTEDKGRDRCYDEKLTNVYLKGLL